MRLTLEAAGEYSCADVAMRFDPVFPNGGIPSRKLDIRQTRFSLLNGGLRRYRWMGTVAEIFVPFLPTMAEDGLVWANIRGRLA